MKNAMRFSSAAVIVLSVLSGCKQKTVYNARSNNYVSRDALGKLPEMPKGAVQNFKPLLTVNGSAIEITLPCDTELFVKIEGAENQLAEKPVCILKAGTHIAEIGEGVYLHQTSSSSQNVEMTQASFPDATCALDATTNVSEGFILKSAAYHTGECKDVPKLSSTVDPGAGKGETSGSGKGETSGGKGGDPTPTPVPTPTIPTNNPGQNGGGKGGDPTPTPTVEPTPTSSTTASTTPGTSETPAASPSTSPSTSPVATNGACKEAGVVQFTSVSALSQSLAELKTGSVGIIGCRQQYIYSPSGVQNLGSKLAASCSFPGFEFRDSQGGARALIAQVDADSSASIKVTMERVMVTNGFNGRCPDKEVTKKNLEGIKSSKKSNWANSDDNCKPIRMEKTFPLKDLQKAQDYVVVPFSQLVDKSNWVGVKGKITVSVADNTGKSCEINFALISPIVLDFTGDAEVTTVDPFDASVTFDWRGDGSRQRTGWISGERAFLGLDLNKNGIIDNGSELIGENTPSGDQGRNGYEVLKGFVKNGQTTITAADDVYSKLIVWFDRNTDGVMQLDEKYSLRDLDVTKLDLNYAVSKQSKKTLTDNDVRFTAKFFGPKQCAAKGCNSYDVYFATYNELARGH